MIRWHTYFMAQADLAAGQSKDSTKVGAVLVAPDDRTVFLPAYNVWPHRVWPVDLAELRALVAATAPLEASVGEGCA